MSFSPQNLRCGSPCSDHLLKMLAKFLSHPITLSATSIPPNSNTILTSYECIFLAHRSVHLVFCISFNPSPDFLTPKKQIQVISQVIFFFLSKSQLNFSLAVSHKEILFYTLLSIFVFTCLPSLHFYLLWVI